MATNWRMKGNYVKNCSCWATCTCDTIGVPAPHKFCEGMAGMHIAEGNFGNVKLDGLNWVAVYHWPGALHEGNGEIQALIDERATQEQRDAILGILSGQNGGPFMQVLASVVSKMHEPKFLPITFTFDKEQRRAKVSVPGYLETTSVPLTIPATGAEQRVIVRMPNGMEYKEMEVAIAAELTSTGPIKFDWKGTHSSLATVEHTDTALIA